MTDTPKGCTKMVSSELAQNVLYHVFCGNVSFYEPLSIYRLVAGGINVSDASAILACAGRMHCSEFSMDIYDDLLCGSISPGERRRLSPSSSLILISFLDVYADAVRVLGRHEIAIEWIYGYRPSIGGRPRDIIENTYGLKAVKLYLERMEYGVYQ